MAAFRSFDQSHSTRMAFVLSGRRIPWKYGWRIAALGILFTAVASFPESARAELLLTEIHYNGPASGTDPDEFVELTNTYSTTLDLSAFSFDQGIDFTFPAMTVLAPLQSLIIVRDSGAFASVFPFVQDSLFDFAGALSNSGETLRLIDAAGAVQWSIPYDDGGAWPASADGGGNSLQLRNATAPLTAPESWIAAAPTPGMWTATSSSSVPGPTSLLLLAAGLGMLPLAGRRHRQDRSRS